MVLTLEGLETMSVDDDIRNICMDLDLDDAKCSRLAGFIRQMVGKKPAKPKRATSRWQQCIAERRKGKPFDPSAIRELAKEYRAGRCP